MVLLESFGYISLGKCTEVDGRVILVDNVGKLTAVLSADSFSFRNGPSIDHSFSTEFSHRGELPIVENSHVTNQQFLFLFALSDLAVSDYRISIGPAQIELMARSWYFGPHINPQYLIRPLTN